MSFIRDSPPELIHHIFRLGCDEDPLSYGWKQIPRSRRIRHPFITTAAPVCRSWQQISRREPNHYFYSTCLELSANLKLTDAFTPFLLSFTEYRRGIMQSEGSNLFIFWNIGPEKELDKFTEPITRIFLHAMHMLLEYQQQVRLIRAWLNVTQVLGYFVLLHKEFESTPSLIWTLGCGGWDWPTFCSSIPSHIYPHPDLDTISRIIRNRSKLDFRIYMKAIAHKHRSFSKSITFLSISHSSIDARTLQSILSHCENAATLLLKTSVTVQEMSDSSEDLALSIIAPSIKTLRFQNISLSQVLIALRSLQFPGLRNIRLHSLTADDTDELPLGKIILPPTVLDVVCNADARKLRTLKAFIFDAHPGGPLTMVRRNTGGKSFEFTCVMLSQSHGADHFWNLRVQQPDGPSAAWFLGQYRERYRDTLEASPAREWLTKILELEARVMKADS